MKVYSTYFAHESNSFSPIPTTLESYSQSCLYRPKTGEGEEILSEELSDDLAMIPILKERGHELHVGPLAATTPSAPTRQADYELLRDEILSSLREAMPVDAVIMFMHGAQLAMGCDDCAGDILQRIRDLVGPNIPVGVELDLHCNISPLMMETADVVIACKEYPHTDFEQEALRLVEIIESAVRQQCTPVMAFFPVPMLGYFHTTREPMRSLVAEARSLEQEQGVLSVSVCHGFALADSVHTGAGVLVVSDGDESRAKSIARTLGEKLFSIRDAVKAPLCTIDEALNAVEENGKGTVVIADTTDNTGGGAAGDSTFILHAMLARGMRNVALAMLWDPMAVSLASKAGPGASLQMRIGGKIGPGSGDPLDVLATVKAVRDDAYQMMFSSRNSLGSAVALEFDGITVIVNDVREQVFDPRCFTELGVDPWQFDAVIVKSSQHFHAAFAPHAEDILYVDAPGATTASFEKLPYRKLLRPVWPIDEPPFEARGRRWT